MLNAIKKFFKDKQKRSFFFVGVGVVAAIVACTAIVISLITKDDKKKPSAVASEPTAIVDSNPVASEAVASEPTPRPTSAPVISTEVEAEVTEGEIPTFAANSKVLNVDVSGMTADAAKEAVKAFYTGYSLPVKLDDQEFKMTSAELGIAFNDASDFNALMKSISENDITGYNSIAAAMITGPDEATILKNLPRVYNRYAHGSDDYISPITKLSTYPSMGYDGVSQSFAPIDGVDYTEYDYADAAKTVLEAATKLSADKVEVTSKQTVIKGTKAADSKTLQDALNTANQYLGLNIVVNFTTTDGVTKTVTFDRYTLSTCISYSPDTGVVSVYDEGISAVCSYLKTQYSKIGSKQAKFLTSAGNYISINAQAGGEMVNTNSLYEKVKSAISTKTSTTIDAEYTVDTNETGVFDFGGNYCEVDLTNQMVYVYHDHQLMVSSPCVTGCVANGTITTPGVWDIWSIETKRYLIGPGYKSWVEYFIAFNGGIGFHDASWRSEFGGDRYLYGGSHGCVNMPLDAVTVLYQYIHLGTKVVVHGGISNLSQAVQSFSGTPTYNTTSTSAAFKLDTAAQGGALLTYTSSNPAVASVSDDGTVTPKSAGTTTITVFANETPAYRCGQTTVTVNVQGSSAQTISGTKSYTLSVGGTQKLDAKASTSLTYSSNNTAVATVDASGNVKAVAAGTATITVNAAADATHQAASTTITITVNANNQTIDASVSNSNLIVGETATISASAKTAVSYTSSDQAVATVDANGNITAVGAGTATITVTAASSSTYNKATKDITITVVAAEEPTPSPEESEGTQDK